MNINEFRQSLPGGGLRPSLFKVFVPFPSFNPNGEATKKLSFNAEASSMPGNNLGTIVLEYMSRDTKWIGDRTFDSWSFTALVDNDMTVFNAFTQWSHGLNSHEGNVRLESAMPISSYQVDVDILMYNVAGKPIYARRLVGAFPTIVSPIDLGWARKNEVARFNVTMEYQYWTDLNTDGESPTLAGLV